LPPEHQGSKEEGREPWAHLHRRQLSGREEALWYLVATVTYIAAAIAEKGLLNWLVGPAWLVAVVTFGPVAADRLRRRP
jgi:hypothetical protein